MKTGESLFENKKVICQISGIIFKGEKGESRCSRRMFKNLVKGEIKYAKDTYRR